MLHELSMINTLKEWGQFTNKFLTICSSNRTCKAGIHISGTKYQDFNIHEKWHEVQNDDQLAPYQPAWLHHSAEQHLDYNLTFPNFF